MARIETWLKCDLQTMVRVQELDGDLFTADNQANRIGVIVTDKGVDSPIQGGIVGYVIRPDETTVIVNGTASGNRGWIDLPASAYIYKGPISIVIKNGNTTIGACHGYMNRSTTDTIVDPGRAIPSISELLAEIANMRTATAAANTATSNANTAASNANTKAGEADTAAANANKKASLANTAATNANSKANLADKAATAANTAASKIDNMTVAANDLPAGSPVTVSISEMDGHKHIVFGLVHGAKGDKGDRGKDFHISKTFVSVAAMMAYTGTDIEAYDFAMIDTGSVQDSDTGKLYCYEPGNNPKWRYIGDLSGAQGIKGETGTGIDHISMNSKYQLTIYYTDGTSDTTASIRGATGVTPDITIGSVATLLPGQQAYVQLDSASTPAHPVINFGIPKGETGSADNVYGTTIPVSESDDTSIKSALDGKVDKVDGKGLSTNDFTSTLKSKLDGISEGANKTIVDSALSSASTNPVQNWAIKSALNDKVDKVDGKGLSTNDFTSTLKSKLNGISNGATRTIVDSSLISTSTNPVQNSVIKAALDGKVDKVDGKGLSTNDFTSALKSKLDGISEGANKTIVDSALSSTSTNPVQNSVVKSALDSKVNTANGVTCDMTVAELMQLGGA